MSYNDAHNVINRFSRFVDSSVLTAIAAGAEISLSDEEDARKSVESIIEKLTDPDVVVEHQMVENVPTIIVKRTKYGNVIETKITPSFVETPDYLTLQSTSTIFKNLLHPGACLLNQKRGKETIQPISNFSEVIEFVLKAGKATVKKMQRYKGLGEMKDVELEETTMDPAKRRLLKVGIEDAVAADMVFTKLMGDEVEPRRQFIEDNALLASNIDT